ncbi:MAG TPA: VanZ family protein [Terriglobales bacterium]|nr:VanZ family protein [Terriglobales bacterium]
MKLEPDALTATAPRQQLWKTWLAAGLWLLLIAIESSNALSSDNTGRILYAIMTFFYGPIDRAWFVQFHHILRKTGHVVGYAILSILLFRAWRATFFRPARWAWLWTALAFSGTALVASMDEWHQSYIPSRTGTYHDVILDSSAALAAQILIYLVVRGWRIGSSLQASA